MGERVLIVDDDTSQIQLLTRCLNPYGYEVLSTTRGQEALSLVVRERPDLVLLDMNLGDIEGWQVCQLVRSISEVPIVFVTGAASRADIDMGYAAGADDYITKPVLPRDLVGRLRNVLCRAGAPCLS